MTDLNLSALLEPGLSRGELIFGPLRTRVPGARIVDTGRRLFSSTSDAESVAAVLTNDVASVELIVGAIVSGVKLISLPAPARAADLLSYATFLRTAMAESGAKVLVARDDLAALLQDAYLSAVPHSNLGPKSIEPLAAPRSEGFELIQFTSGSTAQPKAIALSAATLAQNIVAIMKRVRPQPGDVAVSWLPLSHDMGLIGMLLTSLASIARGWASGGKIVLLEPEDFLRQPSRWMAEIDHWHGTFTASPTFGYALAAKHANGAKLRLGSLRCAIVGGDVVGADTLSVFESAFSSSGLGSQALCPAYGMAELGLAAAMTPPEERWRFTDVETGPLAEGQWQPRSSSSSRTSRLVASGPALHGYSFAGPNARGLLGELKIRTPACGSDATTGEPLADEEGVLATTDVGRLDRDGWIYVCGRNDDYLSIRGRNVYLPAIEEALNDTQGVRAGRVTVAGAPTGDWVVALEALPHLTTDEVKATARAARRAAVSIAQAQPTEVLVVEPGTLPMTSSGKVQRAEVLKRWFTESLSPR